ncbi:MAG: hypothetical protein GY792_37005 [Gammaproteobacteria bacterium]|nr:hypothetical protein [Gammaproteobacteria bacterium]
MSDDKKDTQKKNVFYVLWGIFSGLAILLLGGLTVIYALKRLQLFSLGAESLATFGAFVPIALSIGILLGHFQGEGGWLASRVAGATIVLLLVLFRIIGADKGKYLYHWSFLLLLLSTPALGGWFGWQRKERKETKNDS